MGVRHMIETLGQRLRRLNENIKNIDLKRRKENDKK
jgi:hypothetical protein